MQGALWMRIKQAVCARCPRPQLMPTATDCQINTISAHNSNFRILRTALPYLTIAEIQRDLDGFMAYYNLDRTQKVSRSSLL